MPGESNDFDDLFGEIWDAEWARHLLTMAQEQMRGEVSSKWYQIYDLHVLQEKPVREIVRKLRVSAASVYVAKYRIGKRIAETAKRLEKKHNSRFIQLASVE